MQTDQLIELLARNSGPAPSVWAARRVLPAALAGAVLSATAAIGLFGLLPPSVFASPVPWMKLGYTGALAIAAAWLTTRLSRPAANATNALWLIAVVILAMALVSTVSLSLTPASAQAQAVFGATWWQCPLRVCALSMPALALSFWALRGLAPVRLRAAGASAGLMAGAVSAAAYSLVCPEPSASFVFLWYTLGVGLTACLGAALGPRLLRW